METHAGMPVYGRELLTSKANIALGSSSAVTVRVVSKVERSVNVPRPPSDSAGTGSLPSGKRSRSSGGGREKNMMSVKYTRKAILTFQNVKGADVLIMGMYVQEFGPDSSPMHEGRCLIECIDSPPVWPSFAGAARKAILTAVVLGYIEWAGSNGFKFMYLHVPPPQDCSNYILVRRSLNFRLRVTMHLSYWFKQLLDQATSLGIATNYQCCNSRSDIGCPAGIFESSATVVLPGSPPRAAFRTPPSCLCLPVWCSVYAWLCVAKQEITWETHRERGEPSGGWRGLVGVAVQACLLQ